MSPRAAIEDEVRRARLIAVGLSAGVLAAAAVGGFVRLDPLPFVAQTTLPVALAGLAALVGGWRLFVAAREREPAAAVPEGCARYRTALIVALALTEGAGLLGAVWMLLGARVEALTGVVTHMVLLGALWPTAQKLAPFLPADARHLAE